MNINIRSTKDLAAEHGIKTVVYGFSGVGKTVLCSTAPKPIILSAEGGLLSLAGTDIDFIEVKTIKDIGAAFEYLKKDTEHDTICLDSLSELAEVVLEEFKKTNKDGRQAYMQLSQSFGALIRNFRDLPNKNVVFVAKAKRETDEETGTSSIEPFLPGQVLKFHLPYQVDEVFYMDVDRKGVRSINTSATRKFHAKDRSGKLNDKEEPNLMAIFDKIRA